MLCLGRCSAVVRPAVTVVPPPPSGDHPGMAAAPRGVSLPPPWALSAISRALGWALELREPLLRAVGCWGGSTASSEPHGSLLGATASVRGFAPRLSPGAQSAAQPTLQQQPGRQR